MLPTANRRPGPSASDPPRSKTAPTETIVSRTLYPSQSTRTGMHRRGLTPPPAPEALTPRMATRVPDLVVWPNHPTMLGVRSLLGALGRSLGRRVREEARVAFSLVAAPDLDHFVGMVHGFGAQ